jgi:hypothetical protein
MVEPSVLKMAVSSELCSVANSVTVMDFLMDGHLGGMSATELAVSMAQMLVDSSAFQSVLKMVVSSEFRLVENLAKAMVALLDGC